MSTDLDVLTDVKPGDAELTLACAGELTIAEGSLADPAGVVLSGARGLAIEIAGPVEVDEEYLSGPGRAGLLEAYRQGARWLLELSLPAFGADVGGIESMHRLAARLVVLLGGTVYDPQNA